MIVSCEISCSGPTGRTNEKCKWCTQETHQESNLYRVTAKKLLNEIQDPTMSLESGSAQRTHIRIRMIRIPMGQKKEGAKKDP